MALIFIDGFDKYGPVGIASGSITTPTTLASMLLAEWTQIGSFGANSFIEVVSGLSTTGRAIFFDAGSSLSGASCSCQKTLPTSYSRLIGGIRFNSDLLSVSYVILSMNSTSQCAVTINPSVGTISLRTGGQAGTALATSAASVSAGSTHFLEWDVTIAASGAYHVWLDGISIFSGTGNTRGDGANNSANVILIGRDRPGSSTYDDLYLFDSTGATNNAALLSNPRIETQFPTSDVQTQFTNGAAILGQNYSATTGTNSPGANELFLIKATPASDQTLQSVSCVPVSTNATAKYKAVIYPNSGGSPNGQALIATGTEVVGTTAGSVLTSTFSSPPSLTSGTTYWIGFIADTSIALQEVDGSAVGVKAANTYLSGAPGTCPSVTTNQSTWQVWGNCTGSTVNWVSEDQNPPPGDTSFVSSFTIGNEDLYGFPALTAHPNAIYAVGVKGYLRISDTGVRTVDLRMKSGVTDSAGSNPGQAPGTSYAWADSYFETDPATATAWTEGGLNAASSGIKVAS